MTGAEQARALAETALRGRDWTIAEWADALSAAESQLRTLAAELARRDRDAFRAAELANERAVEAESQLRDAQAEIAAYRASLSAHHNIAHLSREAIAESLGGPCQICARAQHERRAVLARAGAAEKDKL